MASDEGVWRRQRGDTASTPPPPSERTLNRFRWVCVARVLALCGTLVLMLYLALQHQHWIVVVTLGALAIYQVASLIHYVDRTNRDLTRFLLAIRHSDFSQSFTGESLAPGCNELKDAFTNVLSAFRAARAEKEEQARYLQTVVQHVGTGLLAFDTQGNVQLLNTAAKRLLSVARLRNIEELDHVSPELVTALRQLTVQKKALVRVQHANEVQQLALYGTVFRMRQREVTLASVQNIHPELEEKEMEAWQNLVRVLTHEIMNSITPIASLAATAHGVLASADAREESISDVREAVETIHRRSDGLLRFVEAYRSLTRLPAPRFQILSAAALFERIRQLMAQQLKAAQTELVLHVDPPQLELTVDPELCEQALINLLRNAADAVSERQDARITLSAGTDGRGHVLVHVTDNGHGIMPDVLERVFIPFFTTKQDGSGIGLALCRQIMRLHRGTVTVRSTPQVETVFTLWFC